jgi:hypothetical protein
MYQYLSVHIIHALSKNITEEMGGSMRSLEFMHICILLYMFICTYIYLYIRFLERVKGDGEGNEKLRIDAYLYTFVYIYIHLSV